MKYLIALALAHQGLIGPVHDHWIRGYVDKQGYSCCGVNDCEEIDPRWMSGTDSGYLVILPNRPAEMVPYAEVQTSEDGVYWRCKYPSGARRCFFAPKLIN